MTKMKTTGICSYCKKEVKKNARSIVSHLSDCEISKKSNKEKVSEYLIILIEGKYAPEYWLVIKAKADITMKKIDKFIRDIWVECCGHLSSFSDGYSKISMNWEISKVFEKGHKIDYEYDFGTPTEISLSLIQEIEGTDDKEIQILFRNKEIDFTCDECGEKAVIICPICLYENRGTLCESCAEKHSCVIKSGEEILSPIVNSPRVGECGYTGYEDRYVEKYFPNGII